MSQQTRVRDKLNRALIDYDLLMLCLLDMDAVLIYKRSLSPLLRQRQARLGYHL
jgi:hypothetical protein